MAHPHRETMITIRVDPCLASMLKNIPNRSAFIRDAILDALALRCPSCHGAGVLGTADPSAPGKTSTEQAGRQAPAEE